MISVDDILRSYMLKKTPFILLLLISTVLCAEEPASRPPSDIDIVTDKIKNMDIEQVRMDFREKKFREAAAGAGVFLVENPDDDNAAEAVFIRASSLLNLKKFDDAISGFNDLLERFPDNSNVPLTHFMLGQAYFSMARAKNSPESLSLAVEEFKVTADNDKINPSIRAGASYMRAQALFGQGKTEEGISNLERTCRDFHRTNHAFTALTELISIYLKSFETERASEFAKLLVSGYSDFATHPANQAKISEMALIGSEAPEIKADKWFNSEPFSIKDLKGKTVLIHFWSSWCPHCRKVIPRLNELADTFRNENFVLLSVTNLNRQDAAKIESHIASENIKFPVGLDEKSACYAPYAVSAVPAAVLIDSKGKVRWRGHTAGITREMIKPFIDGTAGELDGPVLSLADIEKSARERSPKSSSGGQADKP